MKQGITSVSEVECSTAHTSGVKHVPGRLKVVTDAWLVAFAIAMIIAYFA